MTPERIATERTKFEQSMRTFYPSHRLERHFVGTEFRGYHGAQAQKLWTQWMADAMKGEPVLPGSTPHMVHRIKFPIGDWSGDGHSSCEWFVVQSNKPVEDLRAIHFRAPAELGFEIGDICDEYEESFVRADVAKVLLEKDILKMALAGDLTQDETVEGTLGDDGKFWPGEHDGAKTMLKIWLACYKVLDPSFVYEIENTKETLPTIHFYGFDKEGRHLETPGYGLFCD